MQYFCSQCQKKHDVGDISADMLSLCGVNIVNGINVVTNEMIAQERESGNKAQVDALQTLQDELVAFINHYLNTASKDCLIQVDRDGFVGEARLNAFFALRGKNIRKSVAATEGENPGKALTIPVNYTITLESIYNLYLRYAKSNIDAAAAIFDARNIPEQIKNKIIFKQQFLCEFYADAPNTLRSVYQQNNHDPKGNVRICPYCGRELSYASGTGEEIVVALAGAPRAGKTSCMVAMLSTLHRGDVLPDFTMEVSSHDNKWMALKSEIDLYRNCYRVTKTEDNILEVPGTSFKLKVGQNNFKVITIVDMPGEFWVQQDGKGIDKAFFDKYAGLYENIDCIWFAISKATIQLHNSAAGQTAEIGQKLDKEFNETLEQINNADPHVLRENLSSLRSYLRGRGKEMPPFLVMLSKPDFFIDSNDVKTTCENHVYPLVDKYLENITYTAIQQKVSQENRSELASVIESKPSRLCEVKMWRHTHNVRRYIRQVNSAFLRAIEDNCPKHFYISVSAYGCSADDPKDYKAGIEQPAAGLGIQGHRAPVPYHELYPLLWTLAVNKSLPIGHSITMTKRFMGKLVDDETKEKNFYFDGNDPLDGLEDNSDKEQAQRNEIKGHIAANMLLYNITCDTDLQYQKTTYEERLTLREFFVHKRNS